MCQLERLLGSITKRGETLVVWRVVSNCCKAPGFLGYWLLFQRVILEELQALESLAFIYLRS